MDDRPETRPGVTPRPNGDVFGGAGSTNYSQALRAAYEDPANFDLLYGGPPPDGCWSYSGPAEDAAAPLIVRVERLDAKVAELRAQVADMAEAMRASKGLD